MKIQSAALATAGSLPGGKDLSASATGESIQVAGSKVYSLYIRPTNSYWVTGSHHDMPIGAPEGLYK